MPDIRDEMVEVCRMLYDRRLTASGGNVSARDGNRILVSPRHMGSRYRGRITRDMIVETDAHGNVLSGEGEASRELMIHLDLLREFTAAGAVIHAHPEYTSVFASAEKPIPSAVEYTDDYGDIVLVDPAPAHSEELARNVRRKMRDVAKGFPSGGRAVLLPRHGIVVMGTDMADAFDALERIETSARCRILSKLI
ncbi:MAG: class II aldolase/adducin family protein [bacterium]